MDTPNCIKHLFGRIRKPGYNYEAAEPYKECPEDAFMVMDVTFIEAVNIMYAAMPEEKRTKEGASLIYHAWMAYAIGVSAIGGDIDIPDDWNVLEPTLKKAAKHIKSLVENGLE